MAELSFIVKAIDQASGTLKGVSDELDHMEGRASRLGGILKGGLMVGAGVAVAGIGAMGAVLASSVSAASEAEEITAQLEAVIKSTGGSAGMTADAINDMALSLSEATRYEDDAIVASSALLLTFTKIGKETFPQAQKSILNMATAMKMDLQSATVMVGKALNDPILGITAMSRAGIQFSKDQKETIKTMTEMGDVAGAQALILAELEVQFGGSAEAAGETMAGQMDILRNAMGNVKEEIGGALIPVIKSLILWSGPRLVGGLRKFSDWFRTSLDDVQEFAGKLGRAKDVIADIMDYVRSWGGIGRQNLIRLADIFTDDKDLQVKFANIVLDIQAGIKQIKGAFEEGGLIGAVSEIGKMIGEEVAKIDWASVWSGIATWWETDAVPFATTVAGNIKTWWTGALLPALGKIPWASIGAAMQTAWDTLSSWWETDAVPFATQVANSISAWFTGQVIPVLQTQAPLWGTELTKVLKSAITISGFKLGEDANLAYALGAGYVKLMMESVKALTIAPRLVYDQLKKAFAAGLGDEADWGAMFSTFFGPLGDFLKGALEAVLVSLTGPLTDMISAWWNSLWAPVSGLRSDYSPAGQPHGGMGTYLPVMTVPSVPTSSGIPGAGRSANGAGGYAFNITINAPGGNPQAVAAAAQKGVLAAARSMGIA